MYIHNYMFLLLNNITDLSSYKKTGELKKISENFGKSKKECTFVFKGI